MTLCLKKNEMKKGKKEQTIEQTVLCELQDQHGFSYFSKKVPTQLLFQSISCLNNLAVLL